MAFWLRNYGMPHNGYNKPGAVQADSLKRMFPMAANLRKAT